MSNVFIVLRSHEAGLALRDVPRPVADPDGGVEDEAGQAGLGVGGAVGAVAEVPGAGPRGEEAVHGAEDALAPRHRVHRARAGRGG